MNKGSSTYKILRGVFGSDGPINLSCLYWSSEVIDDSTRIQSTGLPLEFGATIDLTGKNKS
jgi:hypothetical protein